MINKNSSNRGFVKAIILIIIALLIISYLGLNLRSIVNSQTFVDNWAFVREALVGLWNHFLKVPIEFVWNAIFVPLFKKLIG